MDVDRLAALLDYPRLLVEEPPVEDEADVGDAEVLGGAIHEGALNDPGELVLLQDAVGAEPAVLVVERGLVERDLPVRGLAVAVRPEAHGDVERVRVVDGGAQLEPVGHAQDVREHHGMPDAPVLVVLGLVSDQGGA